MNSWQRPARALPRRVRPIGGETTVSYVTRLAEANHLPPATVFRYLGRFFAAPDRDVLSRRAHLNDLAVQRLIVAADLPADRLYRALPELRTAAAPGADLPIDIPAMRWRQLPQGTPTACPRCLARRGIHTPVLVHRPDPWELLCRRHKIWPDEQHTTVDALPELIGAVHAHRRLRRQHGTGHPALQQAEAIVTNWFNFGRPQYPDLRNRWNSRLATIGSSLSTATNATIRIVILPEIVAAAGCLITNQPAGRPSDFAILRSATAVPQRPRPRKLTSRSVEATGGSPTPVATHSANINEKSRIGLLSKHGQTPGQNDQTGQLH
jgi:hypothetical protein